MVVDVCQQNNSLQNGNWGVWSLYKLVATLHHFVGDDQNMILNHIFNSIPDGIGAAFQYEVYSNKTIP